jgi:hypothetical protein
MLSLGEQFHTIHSKTQHSAPEDLKLLKNVWFLLVHTLPITNALALRTLGVIQLFIRIEETSNIQFL